MKDEIRQRYTNCMMLCITMYAYHIISVKNIVFLKKYTYKK